MPVPLANFYLKLMVEKAFVIVMRILRKPDWRIEFHKAVN